MTQYRSSRLFNARAGRYFNAAIDHGFFDEAVLPHVNVFVPSFDEMATVVSLETHISDTGVQSVVAELHRTGASTVALKLGGFGHFVSDALNSHYVPSLDVRVTTTTGAGDSMIAGLIEALASGEAIEPASSLAVATGASCEAADAGALLPQGSITGSESGLNYAVTPEPGIASLAALSGVALSRRARRSCRLAHQH